MPRGSGLERSLKHLSLPVHLHFRDVAVDSHQRFRQGVEKGCAAVEPLFSERCRFQVLGSRSRNWLQLLSKSLTGTPDLGSSSAPSQPASAGLVAGRLKTNFTGFRDYSRQRRNRPCQFQNRLSACGSAEPLPLKQHILKSCFRVHFLAGQLVYSLCMCMYVCMYVCV